MCLLPSSSRRALMMEAAISPETSVNFYEIRRCNIAEGSRLHRFPLLPDILSSFISRLIEFNVF
jgi:hypothetical protein